MTGGLSGSVEDIHGDNDDDVVTAIGAEKLRARFCTRLENEGEGGVEEEEAEEEKEEEEEEE